MTSVFSLQKLTLTQLDRKKRTETDQTFEVLFNPAQYQESYGIEIETTELISGDEAMHFTSSKNNTMAFELVFDSSYVHEYPWQRALKKFESVDEQIDRFFNVAGYPKRSENVASIDPAPMLIRWGRLKYRCLLQQIDIDYTRFDRDGLPTRAKANTLFRAIDEPTKKTRKAPATVDYKGDTLPVFTITVS
jgi:hypothetical protein